MIKKNLMSDFNCDYYHILMAQGFFKKSFKEEQVCFEVFFRYFPFHGGYAIFAGLQSFLELLENGLFSEDTISFLRKQNLFSEEFLQYLSSWHFKGSIDAPSEGDLIFPFTPILRVQGNILECHLLESVLLNILNYQSLVATKASRIFHLAKDTPFIEMGLRRAYGPNGALFASRAAFIGGAQGTSNLVAGEVFDIPIVGSMSHSWVMSHPSEKEAFLSFGRLYPTNQVFLLDTYNTLEQGLPHAIEAFKELKKDGVVKNIKESEVLRAVRLDSGDLDYLSKKIRAKLDKEGLKDIKIMVSDAINEEILAQLKYSKAPIDFLGIGTSLVSKFNTDFPGVYKLVSLLNKDGNWEPKIKISESASKRTIAGRKNTVRFYDKEGFVLLDYVFLEEEREELLTKIEHKEEISIHYPFSPYTKEKIKGYDKARILLTSVLKEGDSRNFPVSLKDIQKNMKNNLGSLQERYKRIINPHIYKVGYSYELSSLTWKAFLENSKKKLL